MIVTPRCISSAVVISNNWVTSDNDIEHEQYTIHVKFDAAYVFTNSTGFIGKEAIQEKELVAIYPTRTRRSGHIVHALSSGDRFLARSNICLNLPDNMYAVFIPKHKYSLNGIIIKDTIFDSDYKGNIKILVECILNDSMIEDGVVLGDLRFYE